MICLSVFLAYYPVFYVMLSSVSQRSPISLIEQSHLSGTTSRQCPELRKLLFHTARKAILVCRETTKQLIIQYPFKE